MRARRGLVSQPAQFAERFVGAMAAGEWQDRVGARGAETEWIVLCGRVQGSLGFNPLLRRTLGSKAVIAYSETISPLYIYIDSFFRAGLDRATCIALRDAGMAEW